MNKTYSIRLNNDELKMLNEIIEYQNIGYDENLINNRYSHSIRYALEAYHAQIVSENNSDNKDFIDLLEKKSEVIFDRFNIIFNKLNEPLNDVDSNIDEVILILQNEGINYE